MMMRDQTARLKHEPAPRVPQPQLLQRRCACGGTPGPDGECAACKAKRLAGEAAAPSAPAPVALSPGPGHAFERVPVALPRPVAARPRAPDRGETPVDGDVAPDVDLAQGVAPPYVGPVVDTLATNRSCCRWASFEKSNDSYTDTATDSRKNIKFTYSVNYVEVDSDARKCVMVNWIQGRAKNKDGTFRKVQMFGNTVDYNFPTMRIDSIDTDPVYWSNATARWNYVAEGTGFYATDSPGPQTWVDGIDYDLKFKMCLYCIDDVSATSDENGSGVKNPLKCIDWVFKAKYDAASGTFTH